MIYQSGVAGINQQTAAELKTQQQLSSGLRVSTPADDPVAATQILSTNAQISLNNQYQTNQQTAQTLLGGLDTTLSQINTLLTSARTTVVQAGNASLTDSERSMLATTLQSQLGQLVGLANSKDANGNYMFSGYQGSTTPFSQTASGATYNGDDGQQQLQLSASRQVAVSVSGADLFQRIRNGNGVFTTAASSSNTGSGSIDTGQITDPTQITGDNYAVTFSGSGSSLTYSITDTTKGTTLQSAQPYISGTSIGVDGMQFAISGTPAAGDQFNLAPSSNQSIFTTLQNAINVLNTPTAGSSTGAASASLTTGVAQALQNIDQALNKTEMVQANVGASENEATSLASTSTATNTNLQSRLSNLQNVDFTQATSDLSAEKTALTAAQESFAKIAQNSLFNYLS
jgi:flagellar hook-associated protein 3 FlgL